MDLNPCVGADDNIYIKLENDEHRNKYYSYIIVYVDDVLCIHKDPDKYLNLVGRYFRLKHTPVCPPMYLRADTSKFVIINDDNEVTFWAMREYIHAKKSL